MYGTVYPVRSDVEVLTVVKLTFCASLPLVTNKVLNDTSGFGGLLGHSHFKICAS